MFGFKSLTAAFREIKTARDDIRTTREDVDQIKKIVQTLERDLPWKLDNAVNEIEFVRRRTNAFLGQGVALTYLTDQSPIFVDPRDSGVAAAVLNGGLYEPTNLNVLMSFVRPDTVFLDIGANVGIFSLQVGHRVRAAGKVYAFEPQAHLTNLVRRSAFLNGLGSLGGVGTIESHGVGVSDKDAKVGFKIPLGHLGGGRIVREPSDDKMVSVVRLDSFFGEDFTCDLVKIDVEGHELQALHGMERILANSRQVKVLFENMGIAEGRGSAIEDFLRKLNFKLYGVADNASLVPLKVGGLAQWDGYALAGKAGDPELEELNRRRFFIYPNQLSLQAATIEDGVLTFKGDVGKIAFHGPYWFLPRGQYRVKLHGELRGSLGMTVATRFGYPLTTCMFADGATSSDFTIERDAVLFECVARPATPETEIRLKRIEIIYC